MQHRPARLMIIILGLFALAGLAGLVVAALPQTPWQFRAARARWEQRRPQHYQMTVRWNDNLGVQYHMRAEVRGSQIVALIDLASGTTADLASLGRDARFLSIEYLFGSIERLLRPEADPRAEIARYHPTLARWLQRCVTRRPQVQYDPTYGFPQLIRYYSDSCEGWLAFRTEARVKIEAFQPLP